jgi:hypothetical protein
MGLSLALLNPPLKRNSGSYTSGHKFISESMALAYLSGYVQATTNCSVAIVDAYLESLTPGEVSAQLEALTPDILGISVTFHPAEENLEELLGEVARWARVPFIVVGGNHATFRFRELLER